MSFSSTYLSAPAPQWPLTPINHLPPSSLSEAQPLTQKGSLFRGLGTPFLPGLHQRWARSSSAVMTVDQLCPKDQDPSTPCFSWALLCPHCLPPLMFTTSKLDPNPQVLFPQVALPNHFHYPQPKAEHGPFLAMKCQGSSFICPFSPSSLMWQVDIPHLQIGSAPESETFWVSA